MDDLKKLGVNTYGRYVDDIFATVYALEQAESCVAFLNSRNVNIKFTYETKINGELSFLDSMVKRVIGNMLQLFIIKRLSLEYTLTGQASHRESSRLVLLRTLLIGFYESVANRRMSKMNWTSLGRSLKRKVMQLK